MMDGLTGTGRPMAQTNVAMSRAKATFITGPATATRILETGEMDGVSPAAFPSIASDVII